MQRILVLIGALFAIHLALLFVHPPGAVALPEGEGLDIGVVFDVGGRGDKSFNDGAYLGAERAARELGARVRFIEPGDGTDREAGLRLLAAEGMDLVIGVGFIFTDDITVLALDYPNVAFAGVDYSIQHDAAGEPVLPPSNVAALKFREEEGSFLAGALAVLAGGAQRVGFVGGMDVPLIHKFEAGYRAGVRHVCNECTVLSQYVGVTPEAFSNPGRGKELALSQYQSGVRVIFHASGSSGLGVFEAARSANRLAIGVDSDQYQEAPGYILTSMVKGIDAVVYEAIRRAGEGTFEGGIFEFGLAEGGVDYVYDDNNRSLISPEVRARVESLRDSIVRGMITVPSIR